MQASPQNLQTTIDEIKALEARYDRTLDELSLLQASYLQTIEKISDLQDEYDRILKTINFKSKSIKRLEEKISTILL